MSTPPQNFEPEYDPRFQGPADEAWPLDEPEDDAFEDDCPYCEGEGCEECDYAGEYE